MKIKRNIFFIVMIFAVLATAGFSLLSGSGAENKISSNITNGDVQIVKLSVSNGQYIMEPSTIKKNIPVRLEADVLKMPGCSKSIVISEFNIRKSFNSRDNFVEFTPDKAGTFYITCSMNMYKGTFNVLESDGKKSNYAEQLSVSAGNSCGYGGGCGCGG